MRKLFALEVTTSDMAGVLPGDEIIVDSNEMPKGNGKDIAVFKVNEEHFVSRFTRFGNQLIMIPENGTIKVLRAANVEIVGKAVGGSIELDTKKAPAGTGALSYA